MTEKTEREAAQSNVAENRKAFHDYHILDTWEAGMVLLGTEVKSIREGRVNLGDSFARIERGEVWLYNVNISAYSHRGYADHEPLRQRKLLMHRDEIARLKARVDQERVSLVPMTLYFRDGRVKVEIGVGKGRTKGDKRQAIAARDVARDVERELGRQRKYAG